MQYTRAIAAGLATALVAVALLRMFEYQHAKHQSLGRQVTAAEGSLRTYIQYGVILLLAGIVGWLVGR